MAESKYHTKKTLEMFPRTGETSTKCLKWRVTLLGRMLLCITDVCELSKSQLAHTTDVQTLPSINVDG